MATKDDKKLLYSLSLLQIEYLLISLFIPLSLCFSTKQQHLTNFGFIRTATTSMQVKIYGWSHL